MKTLQLLAPVVALLLLVGCATPRELFMQGGHGHKPGIDRAAFDLDCPKDQLEITELGHLEFGAKGCGQSASYRFNASYGGWRRVDN